MYKEQKGDGVICILILFVIILYAILCVTKNTAKGNSERITANTYKIVIIENDVKELKKERGTI